MARTRDIILAALALLFMQVAIYAQRTEIEVKKDESGTTVSGTVRGKNSKIGISTNGRDTKITGAVHGRNSEFRVSTDLKDAAASGSVGWKVGGGKLTTSGSVNTRGDWSVGVGGSWSWKRRRRSIEMESTCKSCISVDEIKSPKKLKQYEDNSNIDFAMTAKFHKLSYNSTFTELDFKVVDILDETPINFDFKSAKVFSIYASHGACAMKCLKGIVPGEYLITGRMFQGRLVVSGKFMLLHFPKGTKKIFF